MHVQVVVPVLATEVKKTLRMQWAGRLSLQVQLTTPPLSSSETTTVSTIKKEEVAATFGRVVAVAPSQPGLPQIVEPGRAFGGR